MLDALPTPMRDVYFLPDYAILHRFERDTRAILFTYHKSDKLWVYPFLLRSISEIGGYQLERTLFDIESPYGYGGPLSSTDDADFLSEAHDAFASWCQRQHVVAEFVRLHPLLENQRWLSQQVEVTRDRETLSVQLVDLDDSYYPPDSDSRYMVRRAKRSGVQVTICGTDADFQRFVELYRNAMTHLGADDYYSFNDAYFNGLKRLVKNTWWLLAAEVERELIAAALFLRGHNWLHYHLAASDPGNRIPGVMNLLLYTAAQMGSQNGLRRT